MSKTNSILGAWLALFCAIFWAGYLFGDTAPLFGNAATLALIVLWGIGNALITAYPALSLPYLITLIKRTRLHSLVIAGMITFVWGFHPWLMPIEVGIGITSVMLLIWSSLFLVYRPTQTLLLKIEDAPAWVRDNEGMIKKKTPYGWIELIETAKFKPSASTWFGERSHVIIPIYLGLSDQVKQAISQSAAQLKQTDHVYLGLFVDDVFEKGQKPLGFKTKPNRCLDDLESWLLHLTKNAKTEAEKEQIYLLGASVKPLIPIIEGLADKLNFCGILFFAAPKTHSPLAQLAEQCSFSQWQIDGAQTGHASVNEVVSTIEQSKHSAKRLMLKPALVQTGAAMILALPLAFLLFGLDRSPLEVLFKVEVAGNDELQGYWGDLVNVTWRTSHGTARLLVNGDSKAATGHYHFPLEQPTTLTVSVQTFLGKVLAEKSKQVRLLPSRIDHFKANFKQSTDSKCLASSTHDILLDWQVLGAKTVTLISGDEEKAVSQQETLQKSIQKSTPFQLKIKGVDENGQPITQVRLLPSRIDHFKANFKQSTDSKCLASSTHDILLDWQVLGAKTVTLISGDEEKVPGYQPENVTLGKFFNEGSSIKLGEVAETVTINVKETDNTANQTCYPAKDWKIQIGNETTKRLSIHGAIAAYVFKGGQKIKLMPPTTKAYLQNKKLSLRQLGLKKESVGKISVTTVSSTQAPCFDVSDKDIVPKTSPNINELAFDVELLTENKGWLTCGGKAFQCKKSNGKVQNITLRDFVGARALPKGLMSRRASAATVDLEKWKGGDWKTLFPRAHGIDIQFPDMNRPLVVYVICDNSDNNQGYPIKINNEGRLSYRPFCQNGVATFQIGKTGKTCFISLGANGNSITGLWHKIKEKCSAYYQKAQKTGFRNHEVINGSNEDLYRIDLIFVSLNNSEVANNINQNRQALSEFIQRSKAKKSVLHWLNVKKQSGILAEITDMRKIVERLNKAQQQLRGLGSEHGKINNQLWKGLESWRGWCESHQNDCDVRQKKAVYVVVDKNEVLDEAGEVSCQDIVNGINRLNVSQFGALTLSDNEVSIKSCGEAMSKTQANYLDELFVSRSAKVY